MIIITGTGRSGTSYMSKLLDKLGLNVLGSKAWLADKKAGYENDSIMPVFNEFTNGNTQKVLDSIKNIPKCDVIKTPQFVNRDNPKAVNLFMEYYNPKLIIMFRDFRATANSFIKYNIIPGVGSKHGRLFGHNEIDLLTGIVKNRYNTFINHLESEKIEYTIIDYDKMLNDEDYAVTALSDLLPNINEDTIRK